VTRKLSDLISRGEGAYGSFNRGVAGDSHGAQIDFSEMTVAELQRRQHLPRHHPDRLFAVGKYQVIPSTMDDAVRRLGIDPGARLTNDLQEHIFSNYLIRMKRPQIHAYVTSTPGVSLHKAQEAAAAEWASIADPDTGRSRYGGSGNNKASIAAAEVATALEAMRTNYRQAVDGGASPEAAWASLNAIPAQPNRPALASLHRLSEGDRGTSVRELQQTLDRLGYRDVNGRPLRIDGDFGHRTEEAVKSFQVAHGLPPVGHVGPRTHAALEAARLHGPTPVDPAHPDHALQQQVSRAVDAMERSLRRDPDGNSERLKASLLLTAKQNGLNRVDHVVLSEARGAVQAGQHVFAVQGRLDDPASRRVHVATQQALVTPVQASWTRLADVEVMERAQPRNAHVVAARHGEHGDGMRRTPSP